MGRNKERRTQIKFAYGPTAIKENTCKIEKVCMLVSPPDDLSLIERDKYIRSFCEKHLREVTKRLADYMNVELYEEIEGKKFYKATLLVVNANDKY